MAFYRLLPLPQGKSVAQHQWKKLETPCLVIKMYFLTENYDNESRSLCTAPTVDIFTFAV